MLSGEPMEEFDGTEVQERAEPAAVPKPRANNSPAVDARQRVRSPEARPRTPSGNGGGASASSVSPSSVRGPRAKRAGSARYGSASSSASAARDNFRWRGDMFVAVDKVTPRKVCPARNADPGGLDDALGARLPPR